jgi:serine protease AprX
VPRDGGLDYGNSTAQLNQINLLALHNQGYSASGIIVGILDTGFQRTHAAFNNPLHALSVIAEWDFVNNDNNTAIQPGDASDQHAHGTMILGTLASYLPGTLVGGAYSASFVLCKTEDITQEVPAEEDNYVGGLEFIEAHGADMATSSLGYIDWYTQAQLNGQTAVTTIAVNTATSLGVHCCTAAGNNGHDATPAASHLIAPADAFQEIACGAADAAGVIADFSSDGPTADGRVKPEVLARGVNTWTISPWDNTSLATASGTSLSTPLVACAVACLAQAHPGWTVDQMRNALTNSAGDFIANGTHDPLYVRGYGVINAYAASQDCNGNGLPDLLDLTAHTSTDANANGVPDECEPMLGDMDCNYVVDLKDVAPFVLALMSPAEYQNQFPTCVLQHADVNGDGLIDGRDIQSFVELLLP